MNNSWTRQKIILLQDISSCIDKLANKLKRKYKNDMENINLLITRKLISQMWTRRYLRLPILMEQTAMNRPNSIVYDYNEN